MKEEVLRQAHEASKSYGGLKVFAEKKGLNYGYLRKALHYWRKKEGIR